MNINNLKKDYLVLFEKKFLNFCNRAPIHLTFSILYNEVIVKDVTHNLDYSFEINEECNLNDFIHTIKINLKQNSYPKLIQKIVSKQEPSIEELSLCMKKNNLLFDEAYKKLSYKIERKLFIIDKINLKKNQLIIEDSKTKYQHVWHLKMPVVLFLKEMQNSLSSEEAFLKLQKEGSLLYTYTEI